MKRVFIIAAAIIAVLAACNNSKKETPPETNLAARADSLYQEVLDGHDVAMPKSMKAKQLQERAQALLDSIAKLPEQVRAKAAPYTVQLDSTVKQLGRAQEAMEEWMVNFNMDTLKENAEKRIEYLSSEKVRIEHVKDLVLGSVAKADSLLKAKF